MMGLIKNKNKMGDYELEKGFASYKTIVEYFIGDIVLCNNIAKVDPSIYENFIFKEHEIYQCYLCNISQDEKEQAESYGLLFSYSDMLECDVLLVNHYGTSWDYVLTDCPLFENWDELEKFNNKEA